MDTVTVVGVFCAFFVRRFFVAFGPIYSFSFSVRELTVDCPKMFPDIEFG
jgi:hypothetical protein